MLAWVLSALRDCATLTRRGQARPLGTFGVRAAHVDYGNRPESGAEAAFLARWCAARRVSLTTLEMPATLRRAVTARDEYEKMAREARFNLYGDVVACAVSHGGRTAVLLGHHRGDIQENCLSNALKGGSVLELSGMLVDDTLHGRRVARPLLPLHKEEILRVAHACGVPYFKDTTPKWSTRGRLRDQVQPLLREVYGEGCGRNLERLALESDALAELARRRIFAPFEASVQRTPLGARVEALAFREEGEFFWRSAMRELAHSLGVGALSEKALRVLLSRLQGHKGHGPQRHRAEQTTTFLEEDLEKRQSPVAGWLELKKGWATYLDARGVAFLFSPAAFASPVPDGTPVALDCTTTLGLWKADARTLSADEPPLPPAPASLDELFKTAELAYDLPLRADQILSVRRKGSAKKHAALKALDALTDSQRLRDLIPIAAAAENPNPALDPVKRAPIIIVRLTYRLL